jgi:hypothetical protein
MAAEVDLLSVE